MKSTCKKLPEFKAVELFNYVSPYKRSFGISRMFDIKPNAKTGMFELFIDEIGKGQFKTFDEAVEWANKFNQDDYSMLQIKLMQWEAK